MNVIKIYCGRETTDFAQQNISVVRLPCLYYLFVDVTHELHHSIKPNQFGFQFSFVQEAVVQIL